MTASGNRDSGQEQPADEPVLEHSEHDEALVEEWEDESFPASDPPSNY